MTERARTFALLAAGVAAVQTAVLVWMVWQRVALLRNGQEVVLPVVPVDPRSLFRGDYVILSYPVSDAPGLDSPSGEGLRRGAAVYVTLARQPEGAWRAIRSSLEPPGAVAPDQLVLKGKMRFPALATAKSIRVEYGIESYFVPEGTGRELEDLVRDKQISALIAVDPAGNAAIKGLLVDGVLRYRESPL